MIVLLVAGFTVWRLRNMFASHPLPTYAGSMSADTNKSDPKIVRYEIFGEPGATADINYIDDEGDPNQIIGAPLPWAIEVETDSPAMVGNIVAQGDGDFIGCRILSDGELKDERTIHNYTAYIYCFSKAT
ncbi:membrane protein [Mycolicibacterium gilvum]|uniref:Membrane protein n=1 Tax=Mycolicibacterium gilvum TaxID=1804 RepID=A0A378SQ54_9MYCO|nr:membrane protein [Mycolicibacterium gilvum]